MNCRINRKLFLVASTALFMASCNNNNVKITGVFHGKPDQTVYIEQLAPSKIIDSVKTNSSGSFYYKYKMSKDDPAKFLNLKLGNRFITLLVEKGEQINVNSIYNIPAGYSVEGSEGSELLRSLNKSIADGSNKLDSLYSIFNSSDDSDIRNEISQEITSVYRNLKRESIKFVITNSKSLSSIIALYQTMPNGIVVFNDASDIAYFNMVADSLSLIYPNSPHVKSLLADIDKFRNQVDITKMISNVINSGETSSVPEIEIKDIYDDVQKLSDLKGKVVLLSFWSSDVKNNAMLNSELKEVYNAYKDKGFEIFQVSFDASKHDWISAVNTQSLPWISVNDLKGVDSPLVGIYNISKLPANFLISREGEIIGRDLYGDDMLKSIKSHL
ncbi:MAG: TlpA disulfide reductase family protein [Rikenellaceae bacterium]